jgi:hypothetical protein
VFVKILVKLCGTLHSVFGGEPFCLHDLGYVKDVLWQVSVQKVVAALRQVCVHM